MNIDKHTYAALSDLLARSDESDLRGYRRKRGYETFRAGGISRVTAVTVPDVLCRRGRVQTQVGAPDRRSTVFLPLVTRLAVGHYMSRDGEL